ncbi:MAG: hypothetical protein HONBIEJF_02195 [Fimbriimonadaceae bacterium]|nr:hypothetical protein [Fimbriimonadaceae bacterium]
MPGFNLTADGLQAKWAGADALNFPFPLKIVKLVEISDKRFTALCRFSAGGPDKIRVNLLSPGFEAHFPRGIRFRLKTGQIPYLSWPGASVGPGVPTAATRWAVLSLGSSQPPILVATLGEPSSFRLEGADGDYRLETGKGSKGWYRFCLPLGLRTLPVASVEHLAALVEACARHEGLWTSPSAQVIGSNWSQAGDTLTVTWKLDHPIAVVPTPLAKRTELCLSPLTHADASDEAGPLAYVRGGEIRAMFRPLRIPVGSPVFVNTLDLPAPIGSDPFDAAGVMRLATSAVTYGRDPNWNRFADGVHNDYLLGAKYETEPWTRQTMPYGESEGLEACAVQALIGQALHSLTGQTTPDNSLLTSLIWRMDWRTWRIQGLNDPTALASAAAWNSSVTTRTQGAMLAWELAKDPIQHWLGDSVVAAARSPLRQISGPPVTLSRLGTGWKLSWDAQIGEQRIELLAAATPQLSAISNIQGLKVLERFGTLTITGQATSAGTCQVRLNWPAWAPDLPTLR